MVNKSRQNYTNYHWMVVDDMNDFLTKKEAKHPQYTFSTSQYIFEELDPNAKYLARVDVPSMAKIKKSLIHYHDQVSNKVNIEAMYDLAQLKSWEELWESDIDMMSFYPQILTNMATNDFSIPLNWFVDKLRKIQREKFDKKEVELIIITGAIASNSIDSLNYTIKEFNPNMDILGLNVNIMKAMAKLAAKTDVKSDYCYAIVRNLAHHGLFNQITEDNLSIQMTNTILKHMGHYQTSEYLYDIIQHKNNIIEYGGVVS